MDAVVERICEAVKNSGLSASQVERIAGIPPKTISKWKHTGLKSYTDYLGPLSDTLGVSISWLLEGEKENPAQANPGGGIIGELIKAFESLTPEQQLTMLAQIKAVGQLNITQDER